MNGSFSLIRNHSSKPVSDSSSPLFPNSGFAARDFRLGAGMVIIQPSTGKVVLLNEPARRSWFLPKGRKDVGESLEQAALREAFEESGYRVAPFPVYMLHNQPSAPEDRVLLPRMDTEAIYLTTMSWSAKYNIDGSLRRAAGEYFIHWYLGEIPENAVRHEGVCMPDEVGYVAHVLTWREALQKTSDVLEHSVLCYALKVYHNHLMFCEENEECEERRKEITSNIQKLFISAGQVPA
ncbi:hypothetical protein VNI00_007660 [Paramarasmius palmivorus]|uniref:Nudix hydrolase domain-containing protein n=1 Tax=Paramarasmius palmivorus TaxID=297713 RepID=A0AAW0D2D6_9AGAR